MTESELMDFEHRLTEIDARSKSNQHRIDTLEKSFSEGLGRLTDAVNEQSLAMKDMSGNFRLTVRELEVTNQNIAGMEKHNAEQDKRIEKQDEKITALEKAPGILGNKAWWAVATAVIGVMVGWIVAELLPRMA